MSKYTGSSGIINKTDNKETITLYNLKFDYHSQKKESENNEEDLSQKPYYKIEEKKLEELEKVFKQVKAKIKLNFNLDDFFKNGLASRIPDFLFDIKADKSKSLFIIYDEKNFSQKIKIEVPTSILFVEKLDNNDLIFLVLNERNYELLVYRPGDKGYFLSQKIKETIEGYKRKYKKIKYDVYHYAGKDPEPIFYELFYIKAISGNRFFSVSSYGFKMYALNEKKDYELVMLKPYEKIEFIYEIDTNKFIFGLILRSVEGYGFCGNSYTSYYKLFLNKIELINIKQKEKSNNDNGNNNDNDNDSDNDNDNDNFKLKEKLKFSFISQKMYEYNYSVSLLSDSQINFSDFVILKNKYFINLYKESILIFNMETGKQIKKFEICANGYISDIKKWDCPQNDEFILLDKNNVILFKLIEESSSKVSLNIINYGYFPEVCNIDAIYKKMNKNNNQKNRFYRYDTESNNIFIY